MPTRLPDARTTPRYAGLCTFGRYPRLEDLPTDAAPADWIVYGVPYDTGVTYRPGARFGPRAIRDASQYLKRYSIAHRVDLCEVLSLADAGDAPVGTPYSTRQTLDAVAEFAAGLGDPARSRLLALGGDHSIAYANIKATWRRLGSPRGGLALLHFDSHLDTVDTVWGDKYSHASPFIRLIEEGVVDPRAMLSVGIKGPLNTAKDLDYAREHGVRILTYEDWREEGMRPIHDFVAELKQRPAYLTFDIDCVDPAFAPGTGTPSVGGFTSHEALALVRACKGAAIAGADVVEVLPDRDVAQNTALLAAHVAFEVLCLAAIAR
jgi:agmatinase